MPAHGVARGDSGTVVHVFETADAYLVEFVNPADGSTRALADLTPDQLVPPRRDAPSPTGELGDPVRLSYRAALRALLPIERRLDLVEAE